MKFNKKIIIFSLLVMMLTISAVAAHENVLTDGNNAINDDVIGIHHVDVFNDGLDDDSDDSDDGWDDDLDDSDDDDSDDDSDDWDDDDWDDDDWDDDSDDWDDDDWDDDYDWDDWYDDFDWDDYDYSDENDSGNGTRLIKFLSHDYGRLIAYKPLIAYKTVMANDIATGNSCDDGDESDVDMGEAADDNEKDSYMSGSAPAICVKTTGSSLGDSLNSVSKSIDQSQNIFDDGNETRVDADDEDYDTITSSSGNDLGILGLLASLLLSIVLLII